MVVRWANRRLTVEICSWLGLQNRVGPAGGTDSRAVLLVSVSSFHIDWLDYRVL